MNIAEYQLSLKKLIDETTNETLLNRWKTQMEADVAQAKADNMEESDAERKNTDQGSTTGKNEDDTDGYDIVESGLGIDE